MSETIMALVRVGSLEELPSGGRLVAEIAGTPVLVVRIDDELYAMHNVCSHAHALLSEGELDPDEYCVECPLHGSLFDVRTGIPRTFPAFEPVETYPVFSEGGEIFVEYPA
jgi:3-phenylpropionate/trans-cinnamate dioxygenase ferredoxin subunit